MSASRSRSPLVVSPGLPAGFFHHPRMVALVHLVTLGWITSSILGAFYIVGPLALRMPLPAGTLDRLAFAAYAGGVAGMVSHFWIGEYSGMAWSAGTRYVRTPSAGTGTATDTSRSRIADCGSRIALRL